MLRGPEHLPVGVRRDRLRSVKAETDLHAVVADILRAQGYSSIAITHGPHEQGKDLVAFAPTRTGGEEVLAVIVKRGSISGGVDAKQNLASVETQIKLAYDVPYEGKEVKGVRHVNRALVVCNGNISDAAERQLRAKSHEYRDVEFWDLTRLEQLTTEHCPGFYMDMGAGEREYLVQLHTRCSDLTEEHRRYGARKVRRLADVFIEPTLLLASDLGEGLRARGAQVKKTALAPHFVNPSTYTSNALAAPSKSILLLGEPGSGKSVALKFAVITLVERRLAGDANAPMPLMVSAPQILAHLEHGQVGALLQAMLFGKVGLTVSEVAALLRDKPSTLFVDGMDEIPAGEGRDKVLSFLKELEVTFPRLRTVCAMRLTRLARPESMQAYLQVLVLPLNNHSTRLLVEKILGRGRRMTSVLRALATTGLSRGLPKTPLVVTLMAILHEQEELDELPATITDLYDMFFQVYLGKWNRAGASLAGPLAYAERIAVLRRVACTLHGSGRVVTSLDEITKIAEDYVRVRGHAGGGADLAAELVNHSGLLQCRSMRGGNEEIEFVHLSFQEFLVAAHLAETRQGIDEAVARFSDPWWSAVICFYAGFRKDAPDLIRSVVAQGIPENPFASLAVALQLGHLLQAAMQTPDPVKAEGALYGSDLMQVFFGVYANEQKEGRVTLRVTQLELLISLGIWYSLAYGSAYLRNANAEALLVSLGEFDAASGEERLLWGLRSFCSAAALAHRGDPTGVALFLERVKRHDLPLLQAASALIQVLVDPMLNESAPPKVVEQWEAAKRTLRAFAKKIDAEDMQKSIGKILTPMKGAPRSLVPGAKLGKAIGVQGVDSEGDGPPDS